MSTADGIRSAVRPIALDAAPDLGLSHAVAGARVTVGAGRGLARLSFAKPAVTAVILLLATRSLRAVGLGWYPFPTPVLAWWANLGAYFFTLYAIVALGVSLISLTPTHRVVGGRLQPTRRDPWRSTGPGYAHIKAAKERLTREERRARRDIDKATRLLGRMGAKRRRSWERQWAAEDANGAGRSKPGALDGFLMRQAPKPKAKAVKGSKTKAKTKKGKQLDAELKAEVSRIKAARAEVTLPRLDPSAGPLLAPVSVRPESPEVAGWRQQAEVVQADTVRYLAELQTAEHTRNGFAGYTPPPAPISVRDDQ